MIEQARQQAIKNELRAGAQRMGVASGNAVGGGSAGASRSGGGVGGGGGGGGGAVAAGGGAAGDEVEVRVESKAESEAAARDGGGASVVAGEEKESAKSYLSAIRMYWDWEERYVCRHHLHAPTPPLVLCFL